MPSPNLLIDESFLTDSDGLFQLLIATVAWDERMAARRTASFGKPYNYSQLTYAEQPLTPELVSVAQLLAARLNIRFNNCLLNYYETGDHTMGFHADDTAGLLPGTGVAIVSLGSEREITYRRTADRTQQVSYSLPPGSLLYMDDAVQREWQHSIRRQPGAGPRISLTWRAVAESPTR
jgi:alkylated DNA repair dioxygenase AlkB